MNDISRVFSQRTDIEKRFLKEGYIAVVYEATNAFKGLVSAASKSPEFREAFVDTLRTEYKEYTWTVSGVQRIDVLADNGDDVVLSVSFVDTILTVFLYDNDEEVAEVIAQIVVNLL
jgi:hypothetical protein